MRQPFEYQGTRVDAIAKDNRLFLTSVVIPALCGDRFKSTVISGITDPARYAVEEGRNYIGDIRVNCDHIGRYMAWEPFRKKVDSGILPRVAEEIPSAITGELRDSATVIVDGYRFNFQIYEYERSKDHDYERINDLSLIPEDEKFHPRVMLTIFVQK